MDRFSIGNLIRPISFRQYMETAERLENSIREVNPNITSKLLLTTNAEDYYGAGSLTVITPQREAAAKRREEYNLSDLNEGLWQKAFDRELYIHDNTIKEPYSLCVSNEERDPRRILFFGQCLDKKSQEVFDNFKKTKELFQIIGNGVSKTSPFMVDYARISLGIKK